MKSGVMLIGTGGAASTIVDATGANQRVFYGSGNNANTLIEGFTIKGGFHQTGSGGGILLENDDRTKISRNMP